MPLGVTESILELVGRTPLLHLARFARPPLADVYAKLEYMNPGGSVKDRAALGMILDAERRGVLKAGATIIEPTAGNTGIGLALAAALLIFVTVLLVLFVVFNTQRVEISLVFADVRAPLVLALVIAAALGGLLVALFSLVRRARRSRS